VPAARDAMMCAQDTDARIALDHPSLSHVPAGPDSLKAEERVLAFLAADAAAGRAADVKLDWAHLPAAQHAAGMEALLQNHILVGFPRTINALAAVHEVGVSASAGAAWALEDVGSDAGAAGRAALREVYAGKYDRLRARMASLHPLLDRFMEEHAYGRVIARGGALSLRMRELCTVHPRFLVLTPVSGASPRSEPTSSGC
jgi:alkylhydroperoxidase/carboxymuconolactone decarboxylase family protein YurZ